MRLNNILQRIITLHKDKGVYAPPIYHTRYSVTYVNKMLIKKIIMLIHRKKYKRFLNEIKFEKINNNLTEYGVFYMLLKAFGYNLYERMKIYNKPIRCVCGRILVGYTSDNIDPFIYAKNISYKVSLGKQRIAQTHDDKYYTSLYKYGACSLNCLLFTHPLSRAISHKRDFYSYAVRHIYYLEVIDLKKMKKDKERYLKLFRYYLEMTKLAFASLEGVVDIPIGVDKFDAPSSSDWAFYTDFFWRLYSFTCLLFYKINYIEDKVFSRSFDPVGFMWDTFNPETSKTNKIFNLTNRMQEEIGRSILLYQQLTNKGVGKEFFDFSKEARPKESIYYETLFLETVYDFFKTSQSLESKVLLYAFEKMDFNPFTFLAREIGYSRKLSKANLHKRNAFTRVNKKIIEDTETKQDLKFIKKNSKLFEQYFYGGTEIRDKAFRKLIYNKAKDATKNKTN